ncbi:MAG: hypothetical protein ACLSH8_16535 [Zhenhengia sp.]|uniref:hypothetical protein n=1 Tax=Zhenhengia sp. TaxID=2944208 RepID=UPI003996A61D
MQNIQFENYTYGTKKFKRPITCPHCKISTASTVIEVNEIKSTEKYLNIIYECTSCHKEYYVCYMESAVSLIFDVLGIFPHPIFSERIFPETIHNISPNFPSLYNQAYFAEEHQKFDIAAMGYRKALEVLIKDFAINSLNKPQSEVLKKTLANSISEYLDGFDTFVAAECIRILGNDYTHYELRYTDVDFSYIRKYLDFFITRIEMQAITSSHPLVPVREYSQSESE